MLFPMTAQSMNSAKKLHVIPAVSRVLWVGLFACLFPVSPIHETECKSVEQQAALEADAEGLEQVEDSGERDSPFAVLERLKS